MVHFAVVVFLYFLPTFIAVHRGHSAGGIAILNFFIGWTGIGWLALLLWALVSRPPYCYLPIAPYYPYGYWRR